MADHAPDQTGKATAGAHLTAEQRSALSPEERAAWIETGRLLFAQECRFVHAAQTLEQLPLADGLEVAFAGRSNVGKSSLMNALTGRRALARTSGQPGRTRQLNFFDPRQPPDARGHAGLRLRRGGQASEAGLAGADVRLSSGPANTAASDPAA